MGEYKRFCSTIRDFRPDDDEVKFYIAIEANVQDLFDIAQEKWPGVTIPELHIAAEHIQTHCLGHDEYDPGDYTDYLVITRVNL